MLRSNKKSDQIFELKSYSIIGPVIGTIVCLVGGFFLLQTGTAGEWTVYGEDMLFAGLGAALIIAGISIGIFAPHIKTFVFDKVKNQFSYERKKITGTQDEHCPLKEVKGIYVSKYLRRSSGGSNNKSQTSTVIEYLLEFENGDKILLSKKTKRGRVAAFMSGSTPKPLRELSSFLDIEIVEHGLKENLQAVSGAIKDVIASARSGGEG